MRDRKYEVSEISKSWTKNCLVWTGPEYLAYVWHVHVVSDPDHDHVRQKFSLPLREEAILDVCCMQVKNFTAVVKGELVGAIFHLCNNDNNNYARTRHAKTQQPPLVVFDCAMVFPAAIRTHALLDQRVAPITASALVVALEA